jgi:hemolysin III
VSPDALVMRQRTRRVVWPPRLRGWMRRLDHAGVFLLIAGTYTPVALLVLGGAWRWLVLGFAWGSAAAAIVLSFVRPQAPKWVGAAIGLAIGWGSVAILPQVVDRLDGGAVALLAAGGIVYSIGAVVYACRRPDPRPRVFGYHELFHALTIVAVACQYVAIAFFVIHVG